MYVNIHICVSGLSIPLIGLRPGPGAETGVRAGSEARYSREEVVSLDPKPSVSPVLLT